MDPVQIILAVLAVAGVWAVAELALTLRRARGVVDSLDKTVEQVNNTLEEARPVVAKLDGVVDELQPAIAQVDPLLRQATVAVEALSADLVEVNAVLRDVSAVSGAASSASHAVTGIADAATDKVQQLLGRGRKHEADCPRAFAEGGQEPADTDSAASQGDGPCGEQQAAPRQYFTYESAEEADHE